MKFRSGKYAGQEVAHVKLIAPWYINWVKINLPEMLVERKAQTPKQISTAYRQPAITPNNDFKHTGNEHPRTVIQPLTHITVNYAFASNLFVNMT